MKFMHRRLQRYTNGIKSKKKNKKTSFVLNRHLTKQLVSVLSLAAELKLE